MDLHSKYTDYKIILKTEHKELLEHITDSNRTIQILYYVSGQIQEEWWFLNKKWHREDGPAIIDYYESGQIESKYWLLNNECHREDGPAIIHYNESGEIIDQQFYLNNIHYTYTDFILTPEGQAYLKQQSQHIFN